MKTVFCKVRKKELPAIKDKPMPGAIGTRIMSEISQEAWDEWVNIQTMFINENKMNLMIPEDRKTLSDLLNRFINGEDIGKPAEYTK